MSDDILAGSTAHHQVFADSMRTAWLWWAWKSLANNDLRTSVYCLHRARGERPDWSPMR